MADVTIFHNQNCSTSRYAVEVANDAGANVTEIRYMNKAQHPSADLLGELADALEDPVTDMVRRDQNFRRLELTEEDVVTREQVLSVLAAHPELLQRPILVRDDRAIIGRPKDRILPFVTDGEGEG